MAKLLTITRKVQLPSGSTGGRWVAIYPEVYVTAWGISGGRYEGDLGVPDQNGLAPLYKAGTATPAQLHGAELGDPVPAPVRLTIYPNGTAAQAFTIIGEPRDTGNGTWNLTPITAAQTFYSGTTEYRNLLDATTAAQTAASNANSAAVQARGVVDQAISTISISRANLILTDGGVVTKRDSYANIDPAAPVPPGLFGLGWYSSGATFTVDSNPAAIPANYGINAAYAMATTGGPQRWVATYLDLPRTSRGILRQLVGQWNGNQYDQGVSLVCKIQGAYGSERGVVGQIDTQNQLLKLGYFTPGYVDLVPPIPFASQQGKTYWIELAFDETWYGVKAWPYGGAEPGGYQLTAESTAITGSGSVGAMVRKGTLIMGPRVFTYRAVDSTQSAGAGAVTGEPRGVGGTPGYLTLRDIGTATRSNVTLRTPTTDWDPERFAVIGAQNQVLTRGRTGDVTNLGFTPGREYYLDPGATPNLVPIPSPEPADWPPAAIWNSYRPLYIAGRAFSDGGKTYFEHYADAQVMLSDREPVLTWTLDLLTPPMGTELTTPGPDQYFEKIWSFTSQTSQYTDPGIKILPRASGIIDRGGQKVALRMLDYVKGRFTYAVLGLPDSSDFEALMVLESTDLNEGGPGIQFRSNATTVSADRRAYAVIAKPNQSFVLRWTPGAAVNSPLSAGGPAYTADMTLIYYVVASGNTIRYKLWPYDRTKALADQGQNEPTAWTGEYTAASDTVPGRWGFTHEGNSTTWILWARYARGTKVTWG